MVPIALGYAVSKAVEWVTETVKGENAGRGGPGSDEGGALSSRIGS